MMVAMFEKYKLKILKSKICLYLSKSINLYLKLNRSSLSFNLLLDHIKKLKLLLFEYKN